MDNATTRERLLTATERLLLEQGFEKVSVRSICAAAGANSAAVHYHFGSKDNLVAELLQTRLGPLWAEPLTKVAPGTTSIAECVRIVVEPLTELAADPAGRLYLHLLSRIVLGRQSVAWSARWFSLQPWEEVLRAERPEVSAGEAARRWMLAFELVLQQFGDPLAGDRVPSADAVSTLCAFVAAGLVAEVAQ
jgi:AcrR family transcriptional regulator